MKVTFRALRESYVHLLERTYTVGDAQYWKRGGSFYSWTETGGRKEITQEEYFKALAGGEDEPVKVKKELPKISSYKDASDEDLATLAASGDERATDTIIRRYEKMVHKISNKYFLKGGDKDDLIQTGLIGMWDGIKTYDSEKNDNFGKYIAGVIDNRLKSAIRSEDAGKNQINITAQSFSDPSGTNDGEDGGRTLDDTLASKELSPEEQYVGKEGAERLLKFMKTELGDKERDVIFRFINGSTIPEIAEETGKSYKSVENALMRARNKIKEFRAKNESKKLSMKEAKLIDNLLRKLDRIREGI